MKLFLSFLAFAHLAFAHEYIGQPAPHLCWTDHQNKKVCLDDHKDKVRVLLYNGGFCAPCNAEFRELVPNVGAFAGEPVEFFSISVAGWQSNAQPNAQFLNEWKKKHFVSFPVLAGPKKELYSFIQNPALPEMVIIDKKGVVVFAGINPDVYDTFDRIRDLL